MNRIEDIIMKILNIFKNNIGLTLVELLISLSLVSMVVVVSTMMALMGLKSFNRGIVQSDVQYEVRRTSAKITEELRNATMISLDENSIKALVTTYSTINMDEEMNMLNLNDQDYYTLKFDAKDNTVNINLFAVKYGVTNISTKYEMTTDIQLNNLDLDESTITSDDVIEIHYTLPLESDFDPGW
jgi:hypothetical protein